ncbi:MAG: dihydroxy-acid dehydratase, partial [Anaerolineae bacterium]|nr:dihydroxy-acid dehydratase [Anaerolineae bacterium]
ALIEEGDTIRIDIPEGVLELAVAPDTLAERRQSWKLPEHTRLAPGSLLDRYRRLVSSAMDGARLK